MFKWHIYLFLIFMNQNFLTFGAGSLTLYGIIGPLNMLIYKSDEDKYTQQITDKVMWS